MLRPLNLLRPIPRAHGTGPLTLHHSSRGLSTFINDPIPANLVTNSAILASSRSQGDVIEKGRVEAYMYLDSVFPIRLGFWDIRYLFSVLDEKALLDKAHSLIPLDSAYDTKVHKVSSRAKDGGAFIQFSFLPPSFPSSSTLSPEELAMEKARILSVIEQETRQAIRERGVKPWGATMLGLGRESRAFVVKGRPWMEDLHRFPNQLLRVEFEGPEIGQEELYDVFRPYGHIAQIFPQPPTSKDLPRFALIQYSSIRSATAARNSLHSAVIPSTLPIASPPAPTVLRILYEPRVQAHLIRGWIKDHPRLMLPVIIALIGVLSWAVFDPIRTLAIRAKVDGTLDARKRFVGWLKMETLGRLGLSTVSISSTTGIERQRADAKELISGWLRNMPDTFIVLTGPKGSGKGALLKDCLADSKNVLTIDCDKICKNARDDAKLVSELASAVGYWPQLVLAASLNNLIDLASVGLIGQKAGFSATLDVQLKGILEVTATALKSIAVGNAANAVKEEAKMEKIKASRGEREKILKQLVDGEGIKDGRLDAVAGNGIMSELGVGIEKPKSDDSIVIIGPTSSARVRTLVAEPTNSDVRARAVGHDLPIVVIQGFAAKGEAKQEIMWEVLADWAAVLVENQIAHVIFTSDSVTLAKPLAKALPNKPFSTISLNDASPDIAAQYIESKLAEFDQTLSATSKPFVSLLGGRQTDLELLVQKIRAGLGPEEAVEDIIARNANELRKSFFGEDREEAKSMKWTRAMAWTLMKGLTEHEELKYADILINPPFKSDETALRSLEQAEMITIHHKDGRPSVIRPGKPVFRSSFARLLSDKVFSASLEYELNANSTKSALSELNDASKQLIELSKLFGGPSGNARWIFGGGSSVPKEIQIRVDGLLKEMREAEDKLAKLEVKKGALEKILKEEI